jgi:nucleoside-triphosphatase THEP1
MTFSPRLKIGVAILALVVLFFSNIALQVITIGLLLLISFRRFCRWQALKFWIILIAISCLPFLFIRTSEILHLSMLVCCRSVILYLAMMTIAENISTNKLNSHLPKIIGKKLTATLVLAFNFLPLIKHILIKNYGLFYLRSNANYPRYKQLISYVLTVFKQILNAAECCAENMFLEYKSKNLHVVFITGGKHCGKTTYALKQIEEFKARNWPVSGVVSPGLMQNDCRTTIYAKNIITDEEKLLASRNLKIDDVIVNYGGFSFSNAGYSHARDALNNYIPGGIVFFDEFGSMELARMGYVAEFEKLICANISAIFVVVREELLAKVIKLYKFNDFELIKVPAAFNISI